MPAIQSLYRSAMIPLALAAAVMCSTGARAEATMTVKESERGVVETIDTLQSALEEKGISVFGRVDHQANARKAGLELPPTLLLIFGNPKLGTPLMQANPQIGIDLPMKALAWEADGKVYLAYTDPAALKQRHGIEGQDEVFAKMTKALGAFTDRATKK